MNDFNVGDTVRLNETTLEIYRVPDREYTIVSQVYDPVLTAVVYKLQGIKEEFLGIELEGKNE